MSVQRWPVYRRLRVGAPGAVPSRMTPAAVTVAGDVSHQDLTWAELMTSSASVRRFGDPRTIAGAY